MINKASWNSRSISEMETTEIPTGKMVNIGKQKKKRWEHTTQARSKAVVPVEIVYINDQTQE